MLYKIFIRCALLLLSLGLTGLRAQEAIPASGANASGNGGSVSYSVGQVVYTTSTGTNGAVEQGVQQTYNITVITGVKSANSITLQYSAYPNPVTDFLTLKVEDFKIEDLSYHLCDINGKLLLNHHVDNPLTNIDLSRLPGGTYFLKIIQSNNEVKTFKITKN